jgi:hypothetical protein
LEYSIGKSNRKTLFENSIGNLLETYWKPIGNLLETYWKPIGNLLETYWKPIGNLLENQTYYVKNYERIL